jgi:hypothetical protein
VVAGPDPAVAAVVARTQAFLAALPADQRTLANVPFAAEARTRWAYVPGRYDGVEFGQLDASAMQSLHELLGSLLGAEGVRKTMAIVQLESLLAVMEGRRGQDVSHRDPGRYAVLVCGQPTVDDAFAVRLQGHHVSLHFTFLAGWLVGATPHFLGSNPDEQREGPHAGTRVLAAEADLARELLAGLTPAQRATASLGEDAPPDVLLGPAAEFDVLGPARGLAATQMTTEQRQLLWRLVALCVGNLRGELAARELARLAPQQEALHFAWLGSSEPGRGHYWRVQGATFAIEYDNTQNDANHAHLLWRDRERDFGADPLREHLRHAHDLEPR